MTAQSAMQVAVFGGSFDPPHAGHVLLSAYLGAIASFDRVLVVPVYRHAFEKQLSDFRHRLQMCRLAFQRFSFVEVSAIEAELERPNYTLHTLQAIKRAHPDWLLRLAVGSDVIAESAQWYQFEAVVALAPPYVFARHGSAGGVSGPHLLPAVSSSELRDKLRQCDDPAVRKSASELIPRSVLDYALEHRLYADRA
jgi:nicotinate-nucleotide adenylyltransferase